MLVNTFHFHLSQLSLLHKRNKKGRDPNPQRLCQTAYLVLLFYDKKQRKGNKKTRF
ncbi:hypothetical protein B4113_2402 [Geobacillus sp. B4113_201601]|nr:hypothetical protein B4113_2402 [Geobacillus sp. B4113_201601]